MNTNLTVGQAITASSTVRFSGMILPPRRPSSAVMTALAPGIVDAVAQALGAEPGEDDVVHGADAGAGQHGVDRLQHHRHVDGDPVALADPVVAQDVGQAADFPLELPVIHRAAFARGVRFPYQGRLAPPGVDVAVHAVVAGVEPAVEEPLDLAVFPLEFAHPAERMEPVELLPGLLVPERLGLLDAARVHRSGRLRGRPRGPHRGWRRRGGRWFRGVRLQGVGTWTLHSRKVGGGGTAYSTFGIQ